MTVAGVFGLPHLSEDAVAACADGVLSGAAAARARRHCAECAECAEAVRAQREAALMLRAAASPTMPAGLLDRLAGVPMSTPLPPPGGGLPTALGADGTPVFVAHDPRRPALDRQHRRPAPDRQQPGSQAFAAPPVPGRPAEPRSHRRVLLPAGLIASAAAVVAAGALGSTISTVPQQAGQQPASIQHPARLTDSTGPGGQAEPFGTDRVLPIRPVLATSPRPGRP
ncbi:MAG TPA: hypothetical protein VMB79_01330 [Jatrophihabitans sp.]|nr:hypothetical protein [Jatrophihabitans sp.]